MGEIHLGCSGWHYKHWRGAFYKSNLHYLDQYARVFRSVEVNSTFYRFPTAAQLGKWYASTPDEFVFSIKMNRSITHTKRLRNVGRSLDDFLAICSLLGHKLGPFLIQLPPSFAKDFERFDDFLSALPAHRFAFEFRDVSWLEKDVLARIRRQANLAVVMLGADFNPSGKHSGDFVYIRWHGRGQGLDNYSYREIVYWAQRISEISKEMDVFGYWNNDANAYAPKNCLELIRELGLH